MISPVASAVLCSYPTVYEHPLLGSVDLVWFVAKIATGNVGEVQQHIHSDALFRAITAEWCRLPHERLYKSAALALYIWNGHYENAENALSDRMCDPGFSHNLPLQLAVQQDDPQAIRLLQSDHALMFIPSALLQKKHHAALQLVEEVYDILETSEVQRFMICAAQSGSTEVVRRLLSKNMAAPEVLQEALSVAVLRGYEAIVRVFLERVEVDPNKDGSALMLNAIWQNYPEVVRLLARENLENLDQIANTAVTLNRVEIVDILINSGQLPTLLCAELASTAAKKGFTEVLELLLELESVKEIYMSMRESES